MNGFSQMMIHIHGDIGSFVSPGHIHEQTRGGVCPAR